MSEMEIQGDFMNPKQRLCRLKMESSGAEPKGDLLSFYAGHIIDMIEDAEKAAWNKACEKTVKRMLVTGDDLTSRAETDEARMAMACFTQNVRQYTDGHYPVYEDEMYAEEDPMKEAQYRILRCLRNRAKTAEMDGKEEARWALLSAAATIKNAFLEMRGEEIPFLTLPEDMQ